MIRRALAIVVAAASLGAAAAFGAPPATAAATPAAHVGIVVRFSDSSTMTACVAQGGNGLDVLVRGFPNTEIPTSGPYAGFVVSIDDIGQNPPDDTHYWSYWHAAADGWKYSSTGGGSYTPKPGAVEGWSYVDGRQTAPKPAGFSYRKLCGSQDPQPAPSRTSSSTAPSSQPTYRSSPAPASPHHRPPRVPHSSSPATTSSAPASTPDPQQTRPGPRSTARSTARSSPRPTGRATANHKISARHAAAQPSAPSSAPRTASSAAPAPLPTPSLRPTASRSSTAGFPAWGTVLAVAVVAALGAAAWLQLRRRAE